MLSSAASSPALQGLVVPSRSSPLSAAFASGSPHSVDHHPGDGPGHGIRNRSSLIGIVTAIVGNVLIALALNVQRYAHIRIHRRRVQFRERASQPLLRARGGDSSGGAYGATEPVANGSYGHGSPGDSDGEDSHRSGESDPLAQSFHSRGSAGSSEDEERQAASTYLKDPYWWLGQVLITVGEMGNFLAYGFAPASIVSPLGVVALVSNCVIAPLFFKEVFRQRDFWGVLIAIAGAVTVVLSANQKETKLDPHDVWAAISTLEFEIYSAVVCALIALLMWASPRYGSRTILIDLGLVGLFGGFTALSTKGVSSMLSSTLFKALATPVTYALVLVLLGTAVMQVRYLNKALQRFDSTQVIPTQFVLFTLSVIIGSAVLYRDFERTTVRRAVKFVGGCLLTFFGVFLITSGRPRNDDDEDALSDAEDVEETIGLSKHGRAASQTPLRSAARDSELPASRRSSRTAREDFSDAASKHMFSGPPSCYPAHKMPPSADPRANLGLDGQEERSQQSSRTPEHPGMGMHAFSTDSVFTTGSAISPLSLGLPAPLTSSDRHPLVRRPQTVSTPNMHAAHPATPRPSTMSRAFSSARKVPLISPSPFSSTLSAVVADKLLPPHDGSLRRTSSSSRQRRRSLVGGFFAAPAADADDATVRGPPESPRHHHHHHHHHHAPAAADGLRPPAEVPAARRARSFSTSLGELLGLGRRREEEEEEPGEGDPALAAAPPRPALASESTETL